MPIARPTRLLIADDHAPFAALVEALLAEETSIQVVGVARDGAEAVDLAATLEPDVVLLDIDMPRLDGFQAAERIRERNPTIRVVIVTGQPAPENGDRARDLGASGYVLKTDVPSELVRAIHSPAAA